MKEGLFNILGVLSLVLGVIGAFLPILPTTPFILLSSYLFSKGSPRFHKWLVENPYFGKIILNWEKNGVINKKVKFIAVSTLVTLVIWIGLFALYDLWLKVLVSAILVITAAYILTRPSS